nr:hypothetical protein [Tanacetum cinerariifolium]
VTLPPQKRLGITLGPGYEVGESSSAAAARLAGGLRADYEFVATTDREIMRDLEREGQQGLAGGPTQPELPEEADQETINTTTVTNAQLQAMIDQGVTVALASRDALRSTNGDDSHNSRTCVRRTERATRECTYIDFLKCQPLPFKGTEGVASLSQWCERMESVFHISNCAVENQAKFATCTIHSAALTWWNTHVKTVGHEAAYGMPWKTLIKMMTDKYYPQNEIKKLKIELWDLKVKESDKIDKYIGGLPDMIHGSVVASKPKTMQEAVEIATELMDKKIRTSTECETASKRKFENTSRNTQNQQQQPNKRHNTGRVYTATSGEKKQYGGSKPLCAKCDYHHDGTCALKCRNCKKIGHFARDCRNTANTNNANNQRGTGLGQKSVCYECGVQGHFKIECPKLKNNNNHGNQGGRNNAPVRVYVVSRAGTDPDVNVVTELGSFDAIIDMDWLAKYQAVIACAEKIVCIPWGNETLIIHSDGSNQGNATRLSIILCTKTNKYMMKGFPIFLAHITTKKVEDKSKKKRLEDVPIVRDFPKEFPEDLPAQEAHQVKYPQNNNELKTLAAHARILKDLPESSYDLS